MYATLSDGTLLKIGITTFEVKELSASSIQTSSYDDSTGAFKVTVSGIKSISGVRSVQIPVWSQTNQGDIKWYNASRQTDGSYVAYIDPMYHQYNSGTYKIHVYVTGENGISSFVGRTEQNVMATKFYSIMGESTVTVSQMVQYYQTSGHKYPSAELGVGGAATIEQFCQLYIEEASAEGVRAEVAFTQAMRETGWLQYGGIVKIEQFNFAGIGALDGNTTGNCASFPNVRTGIRAQIQHLKAYGSKEALNNECVDPRFALVRRGVAPFVEWLGIHENPSGVGWATEPGYGTGISNMIKILKSM